MLTYDSDGTITDTATDGTVSLIGYENNLDIYINSNELYIQEENGLLALLDYPEEITAGTNITQVDDYTVKVDLSSVTGISVQTNDGQDSINLDSSFSGFTGSLNLNAGSVTNGDSVIINSDLFTAGGDLSIQAESIAIPQNTTISTRQISGTDYLNDASTGNSGAIDFDARTLSLDGTNLYAHVLDEDTTNTAGNIDLHVKEEAISTVFGGFDTFDVDVSLDPVDVNVDLGFDSADDSVATLDLIGANLLGADITLDADASYDEDSFLSTIDNYSLFLGAAIVEATAKVNIDSNSTIDAASLTANALTNTDAISTPVSLGIDIGIAYGSLDATAEVVIDGNVTVDGDLNLSTTSDNTIDVEADVGGYQNVAGAVAISEVNTTSRAQIGTTANINVGGNLSIDADTIDQNYTLARSTTGDDGNVGIAASVSLENGSTEALLDSQNTTVAGNITLDADQSSGSVPKYTDYYTAGGVAAFANVGSDSTGDFVTDTQFGILGSILNGAKGLKNLFSSKSDAVDEQTEGASSSFDLGAAVAYASDINNVTARIGDGAVVKSTNGSIDLDATATNRPNVSAGSGVSGSGGSSSTNTTNENSEFAGSAAVAIGDYNNNTYAYIGDGATVDARQAIDIKAESLNDYETSWGINLVEPFTDDSLEDDDRFPTFIANFASYLNDNLGLDNYVFDSWSQATAEGADVGIAGAVTWLDLNHISEAYIGDNAQINQDDTLRSDNQTVAVNAESINEAVHLGGNIQVPGGITGNFNKLSIPDINKDVGGTDNKSGIGGTVLVVNYDNDTKAKIGDGVKLYADSLEVDADTTAMSVSLAASGGEAQKFGFNGTGTWFFVDNDTTAQIHSGANIAVGDNAVEGSTASLVVDATDKSDIINMSGGIAVSENIGIGASISFNTVDRNTQALIGTLDDETAPTTKKKLIVDGDVDIDAQNEGYIGSFALASAVAKEETHEQPESTADYGSAAEEDASWGIGISGEASINKISDNTEAYVSDIDIESSDTVNIQPDIDLTAANTSEILTVGGSVAISLYDSDSSASAGIAGSFGKNTINNSTNAYTENSAIDGGNLTLLADNNVDIISVNASGAGDFNDKGYALAGSVAINEINNDTLAYLSNTDITATAIDLDAKDNSTIAAVAGSLAYGGKGGIGASVAINVIGDLEGADNNTTKAYVENSDLDLNSLDITGTNDSEITSIAVSVGLAKDSMAGSFSITYNRINNDTEAYLLNNGTQIVDVAGDINILARDNSEIYAHAYPVSASFSGSAVGLALAINEVTNNTISYVDNATVNAENLTVEATDDRIVQSIAVGGAIANKFGISGSISVVEIGTADTDNQTTAYIGASAVVTADNNVVVSAEDNSEVFSLAGNVSFGTSGAIGVANSTLSTHNKVRAYVAGEADVTALGLNSDTLVHIGTVGGDFEPEEDSVRGLVVTAVSTRDLQAYAVSGAISSGNLSAAASLSLTLLDEETEAYIGSGATVNGDNSSAGSSQGVYVRAGNHSKLIGAGGGVSGSSNTGFGAGGDGSVLTHTTRAYIDSAAVVNAQQAIEITADASQDIQSYAASGAFGGTLGVSGAVSYIGVENATHAYIANSSSSSDRSIVTSQGNILVAATDTTDADPFAGNLAFGGTAGIGASVGIIDLDKDTQAYIGNNAEVNALASSSATLSVYDNADSGYTTTTGVKGLAVNAFSSEDIDNIAVGGTAAGTFGFAGSLTYSEIDSDTMAYTGASAQINQATGASSTQDVNITAVNDLDLYALDGAVAGAGVVSLAGAVDIANIRNGTEAFIGAGSAVNAQRDITVNALNDKTLENLVVSGSGAGKVALGGSVTVYNIGGTFSSSYEADGSVSDALEQNGDTAQDSLQEATNNLGIDRTLFDASALSGTDIATAYIGAGATVTAGGEIGVNAQENLDLDSFLGQASGAGIAALGGSVGVFDIDLTTKAFISSSAVVSSNSNITVDAEYVNDTDVTSLAGQASGIASIGGAVAVVTDDSDTTAYSLGTINNANNFTIRSNSDRNIKIVTGNASLAGAVAAGVSWGEANIGGSTNAYLGGTVVNANSIDVTADGRDTTDVYTIAISGGIGVALNGSVARSTIDSRTNAYITNSANIGTAGTVSTISVTAVTTPQIITFAEGYGAASGTAVGASGAYGAAETQTSAYVGNGARVAATNFNLTAEQQKPTSGMTVETDATASGGALYRSINASLAEAYDEGTVTIDVRENADLDVTDTLALTATLTSDCDAFADGYNGGILAAGANFAYAESDTSNQIGLASGADIDAGSLNITVDGNENNYAEAIAGGGGIVSGRAAEAITDSVSNTTVTIDSIIEVDAIDMFVGHDTTFNAKSDSTNASLVGSSGANSSNSVSADIAVNFNSNAHITAEDDFDVFVNNNITQADISGQNAESGSGGVVDSPAVETTTTISNTSVINVNDNAVIKVGDEDRDTVDNLDFTILNDVDATAESKLTSGGVISSAESVTKITNDVNEAIINIGNADITSTHDINFSTRAIANFETEANASAWGLSGVSQGESLAQADIDNQINLNNNASVTAERDINFWVGENKYGNANDIDIAAYTYLWNRSASQMDKDDIKANSNLTLNNTISIDSNAELFSSENINLVTNDGSYSTVAEGEGTEAFDTDDIVGSVIGLVTEGDASNLITTGSTSETATDGISVDGSVVAGINNQQFLNITGDSSNPIYTLSDQIESEPTVITEDVTASIDATIAALETERSQYENSDDQADVAQYATLTAEIEFWENEKAKIGDGEVTVIELPNISASVGSISIEGSSLTGAGSIEARGNAAIDVTNETDAYLRVNDVSISDNYGGELLFNNAAITSSSDLDEGDNLTISTGSDQGEPEINIFHQSDTILEIKGSLINRNGSVNVTNTNGSIYVTDGEISAKSINIDSGESFFLSDGYLFPVGSSPEGAGLWGNDFNTFIGDSESEDNLTYTDGSLQYRDESDNLFFSIREDSIANQSTVDTRINNSTGGLSAEASVFIASEYINIAGNIQSGVSDYDLTIDSSIDSAISEYENNYTGKYEYYNGKYYLLADNDSWAGTQAQAEALGGSLVTINDAAENAWLYDTFGGSRELWIGLSDASQEGNFEWVNGGALDYTNWDRNEPDNLHFGSYYGSAYSYDYVAMKKNGDWGDFFSTNNSFNRQGIIELDGDSEYIQELFSSEYDLTNNLSSASGTNISGYYNPVTDSIVIDDIATQGGYVQLVGNVLSTGNGNIEAMAGFANINIDNNTNYDLELGELNTGDEGVEGRVVIIDNGSGTPVTTIYTKDGEGNVTKTVDGVEVTENLDTYTPQETDPYNWRYQKEQTLTLVPDFSAFKTNFNGLINGTDYHAYGDSLYVVTRTPGNWFAAQSIATIFGGDLATINDAAENAWVKNTFSSYGNLWIGYSDTTDSRVGSTEGNFVWVSGETSTYTNWNSGEPNNSGNEDYVEMYPSGLWNDNDTNSDGDNNYGVIEIPLNALDFTVSDVDNYVDPENPEVYVYERPSTAGLGLYDAIFTSVFSSLFNFASAVEDPSFKAVTYGEGLQVDANQNLITLNANANYVAAVPSQYDIGISFIGHDTATVDVSSTNNILLTGNVTNRAGDVSLSSNSGSVTATSDIEITANKLTIDAANGSIGDSDIALGTNLDGGTLNATATGDIHINETTGDVTVDTVSTSGNVDIEAYGNIAADSSSSQVTAGEINLTSETGDIGSSSLDVNIDSGSSATGSVTLDAAGDVRVTETAGDLYLISADSNNGDVSISVSNGNLIDYNPEETEDLAARADLLDTVWSEMELTDEDIADTTTDETGVASAAADEALTAYEQSKETEYQLYWQYRNINAVYDDNGNVTSYTYDDYDLDYSFSFDDATRTSLEEAGYSDSAIASLEDNKTEQYHNLHEELATSGLTEDYDPNYTYTATTEETTSITDDAVWTVDELTRVVNPGLLLPVSDTEVNVEADNIQATNLTLNVGGGIGINEGTINIAVRDNGGNILSISDDDLLVLLTAEPNDVAYLDSLGNEVSDPNDNLESVYTIAIAQIDDLDFEATGELTVTATDNVYLGSEENITINDLDVGANEIRLKSGAGISGVASDVPISANTHITASNITLEAGDNSIGSETTPIEIDTEVLTARANNDLYINQSSADLSANDLEINQIYAGDNVEITAEGAVSDGNNTDDENVRSTDITIYSGSGFSVGSSDYYLGTSDNYLDVYVEPGGTYNLGTESDAYIRNTSGTGEINIDFSGTAGTLSYSNGIYTLTVTDGIVGSASGTSVNFTGFGTINLNLDTVIVPSISQDNSFVVESLASETTLNILGDGNNNTIELSNSLQGKVNVDGETGTNTLVLDDGDDTAANSYNLNETEIAGYTDETIIYSNIDTIEIQSGSSNSDTLTVTNESDTTRIITADNSSITDTSFPDIDHSGIETISYSAESGSNSLDLVSFTDANIGLTVYNNIGDNENTLDITTPSNHANIVVAVAENPIILKVADINHSSNSFTLSGTDADKFEIVNTNELHFISAPDFEAQSSYEVTVIADGTDNIDLSISITDVNETPSLSLNNSNLSIAEDTDTISGVKIGDITITDDALGDETLSLSGDDADLFELRNDTELYLVAETELDYETTPSLSVTVTADDDTFSVPLDLTVNITDANEPATIEFDYARTTASQVLVLDGDGDYVDTDSYMLDLTSAEFTLEAWIQTTETSQGIIGKDDGDATWETREKAFYIDDVGQVVFSGNGNGSIVGSTPVNDGKWHHVAVVWDYANSQGYIYVDGVNDTASDSYSPTQADNDSDTVKLGLTDSYFSGKLNEVRIWGQALSEEDIKSRLVDTLEGDEENLVAYYDFENDSTTEVVDVSGTYYENSFYGTIQGDAYKEGDRIVTSLSEDTDTSSRIKIAEITIDDDALGTNNLSLSGDDASLFELDGTTVYLAANATLDYEPNPVLDVTVEVDDTTVGSTPDDTEDLRVVLNDSNDAPGISATQIEFIFSENVDTSSRIKVADLTITDEDSVSSDYTLSLSGSDADLFEVDGTELYLATNATLDYETNALLSVVVEVDDATFGEGADNSVELTFSVTNANEVFTLAYNTPNQSLALDGDGGYVDTNAPIVDLTYNSFTIEAWIKTSVTGRVIIAQNDSDNRLENREKVLFTDGSGRINFLGVSNGTIKGTTAVTDDLWHHVAVVWDYNARTGYIYVDGVDDTASSGYRTTVGDNGRNTLKFGIGFSQYSGEMDEVRIWDKALTSSEIYDNFDRTSNLTGEEENLVAYYTFQADTTNLNTVTTITEVTGNHSDATLFNNARITDNDGLNIDNNIGDIPIAENSADSSSVKIADINIIDDIYSVSDLIITGNDADKFAISGTEILINSGTELDFETNTELEFTVQFGDDSVEAAEDYTVTVSDANEGATIALTSTITEIDENADTTERIEVARITVSDDALGTNNLSVSGDDAEYFEIEDEVLYLKANTTLDRENQSAYNVTVEVDDTAIGSTFEDSASYTLNLNDVNEVPTAIDLTTESTNLSDRLFLTGNNNYIETNAGIIDFSNDFTLETWIQTTASSQGILTKNDGDIRSEVGERSWFVNSNGTVTFRTNQNNGLGSLNGNTKVNDGELHHIAVVSDLTENKLYLYVDGELDNSAVYDGGFFRVVDDINSNTIKIGAQNYYLGRNHFSGFLNNIRIWNTPRTQSEIASNLTTNLTGTETGLVAYYNNFSNVYSTLTLSDATGNYDGTMMGYDAAAGEIPLPENLDTTNSIKLARFTITDEDISDTNTVSITGDNSDLFEVVAIGNRTYELHLAAGASIDYETTPRLNIEIEIRDSELNDEALLTQSFTVVVANQNEAPSLSAENVVTEINENIDTGESEERIKIADINVSDEDNDNSVLNTLSLSGTDVNNFELDGSNLYLKTGTILNYESITQYDVTVALDDPTFSTGIEDLIDFSIAINDANDIFDTSVTLNSNVTTDVLALDGGNYADGDYVEVSEVNSDGINLVNSFGVDSTFEAWIKTTASDRGIFAETNSDGQISVGERALTINSSGQVEFVAQTGLRYTVTGETAVNDGEWHHVALVLDGTQALIYVDGNFESSGRYYSFALGEQPGQTLRLGTDSTFNYFDGEMRDVRFWNAPRTQIEIQGDLTNSLTGTETDLAAYYDFTDSSNTTAIDQTGNGADGTLVDDASKELVVLLSEDTDTTARIEIADFSITDEDTDSSFLNNNPALTGADSDLFEIDGTAVYLKAATTLDYDTKATFDLALEFSDDGNNSDGFVFDIGLTPVNDAPTITVENTVTSLPEDTDTSSAIKVAEFTISDNSEAIEAMLTGDDADKFEAIDVASDVFTFDLETDFDSDTPSFTVENVETLLRNDSEISEAVKVADITVDNGFTLNEITLSGDDADKFEIIDNSELYLVAGTTLEYEIGTSLAVTVEIDDGVNSESVSLNFALSETNTQIKELYLVAGTALDYETDTSFDVIVEASDGANSETNNLSIAITDVNEAPIVSLENKVTSIEENTDTTSRIKIADIVVTDDDADDNEIAVAGYILGGENTDYQNFEVDGTELYLKAGTTLDYEQQNDYRFNIEVGDSTNTTTVRYDLEVTNIIENSVDLSIVTSIRDGDHWSDGAVIASSRDTTERFKVADLVITGGEGNETFSFTGFYADDFEIDGNELYVKAGADITKYWQNEGFVELLISVNGSDTTKWLEMVFISPEIELFNRNDVVVNEFGWERWAYYNSGDSKDFGSVSVASGSIEYEFEIASWGYDSLTIEDVTITGADSDHFQILSNDPDGSSEFPYLGETPTILASNEGAFITVEFDPSSGGDLSAAIEFTSNDASDNPYIVYLTGTGIGSEINVDGGETEFADGDTQDFGILEIDTETSQRTFTITNNGNEALSISDIAITGTNAAEFTTDFSVSEIAVGESADLTVNFAPTGGGDRTATLTIDNNDDDEGAYTINLIGNGAIAEIDLVQEDRELPSGTTQDFGSVNVDTGELQQTITIQNTGSKTLNLGDIKVTGTNATYFILENGSAIANTQLEAGDSSDLTITFNPRIAETASATLTINSDDSDEAAYTINLTGTGTESTEVTGSDNNDVIDNDDNNQTVNAGAGDDIVTGNDSGERVTGGDGADQVYGEDGNDRNYGDAGDDVLVGGDGRDFLRGGTDNDLIFGGDDNDYLIGDDGEDYLDGELGSDRLRGGNDSDTFVLRSGDGTDLILDFNVDEDQFELDGLEVSDLTFEDDGFGLIKSGDETLAQVRNVTASQLEDYFTNKYSS